MKLNTTHIISGGMGSPISKSKLFPKKMFTLSQIWMPVPPFVFKTQNKLLQRHKTEPVAEYSSSIIVLFFK